MEHDQRISLEAVAIAMFESYLRQRDNDGRREPIQDWRALTSEARNSWRKQALDHVREEFQ